MRDFRISSFISFLISFLYFFLFDYFYFSLFFASLNLNWHPKVAAVDSPKESASDMTICISLFSLGDFTLNSYMFSRSIVSFSLTDGGVKDIILGRAFFVVAQLVLVTNVALVLILSRYKSIEEQKYVPAKKQRNMNTSHS